MASLDVNLQDGKGWSTIKCSASISSLKTFATKYRKQVGNDGSSSQITFRIFDDMEVISLVGKQVSDRLKWGKGNGKTRLDSHLGADINPKKCRCGAVAEVGFDLRNYMYSVNCSSQSCPAKTTSVHSLVAIELWSKL